MRTYFDNYLATKRSILRVYRGIRLSRVMATDLVYAHEVGIPKHRLKKALSQATKQPDSRYFANALSQEGLIFTASVIRARPDYKELVDAYASLSDANYQILDFSYASRRKIAWKHLFPSFLDAVRLEVSSHKNLRFKLYAFLRFIWYRNYLDALFDAAVSVRTSGCVLFDSSTREDAVLCTFLNRMNIPTISGQHGIFFHHQDSFGAPPVSVIMGENVNAKYFLAWGKQTLDVIAKYNEHCTVLITGNPKVKEFMAPMPRQLNAILVCLARPEYDEYNHELMRLVATANESMYAQIVVKLHPRSSILDYKQYENERLYVIGKEFTISELLILGRFNLAIVYNSTSMVDIQPWGVPVITYDSKSSFIVNGPQRFSNYKELIHLLYNSANSEHGNDAQTNPFLVPLRLKAGDYRKIISDSLTNSLSR